MKYLKKHNIKESKKDSETEFDKDTMDFLQQKVTSDPDEYGRTKTDFAIPRQKQGAWMIQNHTMSKDNDLFFFIARPTFKENEDGNYRKTWEIETLYKMDRETPDVSAPEMMKIRAQHQGDESKVYFLWIQRDMLKDLTDSEDDSVVYGKDLEEFVIDVIMQKAIEV